MFMATTNKVLIADGNNIIELKGEELKAFEADRKATRDAQEILEAEQSAKAAARQAALTKLAEVAGLTEEELNAIL